METHLQKLKNLNIATAEQKLSVGPPKHGSRVSLQMLCAWSTPAGPPPAGPPPAEGAAHAELETPYKPSHSPETLPHRHDKLSVSASPQPHFDTAY